MVCAGVRSAACNVVFPIEDNAQGIHSMTDATTHIIAKLERMLQPVPVTVNGNVIEQRPALVGPFKRSDIELLIKAAKGEQEE